jgi:NifU-like protein involved in Fe-S cluster formation
LDKKKGRTTKEAPKLTKKQEEMIEAQKQKESKIKQDMQKVLLYRSAYIIRNWY